MAAVTPVLLHVSEGPSFSSASSSRSWRVKLFHKRMKSSALFFFFANILLNECSTTFLLFADDCQRLKYTRHHYNLRHNFAQEVYQCTSTFLWEGGFQLIL